MLTLFDLLPKRLKTPRRQGQAPVSANGKQHGAGARHRPIQERYDALVIAMKQRYGIRVRKWRSSMTGVAWQVVYQDGTIANLIEAPYPRGPMSAAIFLHEVGHHAIGLQRYKPRCYEEYRAWQWALQAMREHGIRVTDRVERRVAESLHYAVAKARRRGLKRLPVELEPYLHAPIAALLLNCLWQKPRQARRSP